MKQYYKENSKYEILTPNGWEDFEGIIKNEKANKEGMLIETDIGTITATLDHIFYTPDPTKVSNLQIGDSISTKFGLKTITKLSSIILDITYDIFNATNHIVIASNYYSHQCDEFSFVQPNMAAEFWTSVQPTLSTGGGCVITSTPNGDEDIFAQTWRGAVDNLGPDGLELPGGVGKNGFKSCLIKWDRHPERDEEWAEEQRNQLGVERFSREHDCEFITAEETLITSTVLRRLEGIDPKFLTGQVRWYGNIKPNHMYVIGLDPATGTAINDGDQAAIQIFELPTMNQVGEWCSNRVDVKGQVMAILDILRYIKTELQSFPDQTMDAGDSIYWSFENNGVGEAVGVLIREIGEDIFPGYLMHEPKRAGRRSSRLGLSTSAKPKLTACVQLKSLVETERLKMYSKGLITELKHYIKTTVSFAAKQGMHDDLVSSLLLVVRMVDTIKNYDPEMTKQLTEVIDAVEGGTNEPMPFILMSSF